MNILEKITDFGAIDAENDTKLMEYFYRSNIIDSLYSYEKAMIIGRKGTGKTAIYKYILNEKSQESVSLLFRDYPWKTHDNYKNKDVSDRESYINSWTFLFYIEIFKQCIRNIDRINSKDTKKKIKKLEKWIKKNWGSIDFDHREILAKNKKKYKFILAPQVLGNSLGSLQKDFENNDNIGSTLSDYNKKFENITIEIIKEINFEIILLFDELDLSYSPDDNEYSNRLIGLLLTAYNFFSKYKEKIRVYTFLRNDIFNFLEFQDKNKLKDNMIEFLDWDSSTVSSKLSLKELISNRIKNNINGQSDNFERNWSEIFNSDNIGRNQLKWNFIIERTFVRPRDIIKLMNLALVQAKSRLKNDPASIDKITNEDIHNIRAKYSTYLFEELKDEVTSKYNDFNTYLEILRDIHSMGFTYEDFSKSYNSLNIKDSTGLEIDTILERLYEFSIISFYKPGGGGYGGSEYRFQFKSDYQAFNPRASKFRVHYGFKEYLELNE